jgi:hypothetical protein
MLVGVEPLFAMRAFERFVLVLAVRQQVYLEVRLS